MEKSATTSPLPVPIVAAKLVKFWESTTGRDRTCRTAQYFAKFLSYYLAQQGAHNKEIVAKLNALSTNLSMARKAFRLFKSIDFYVKLSKVLAIPLDQYPNLITPILQIINNICYGLYMACDAYTWAAKIKFINDPQAAKITRQGNFFWFFALAASLMQNLMKLQKAVAKVGDAGEEEKTIKSKSDLRTAYIATMKDACDFFIPLAANKYGVWYPNDGVVGILGTASSLLGAYQAWPSK
jgi:peroxin-11B